MGRRIVIVQGHPDPRGDRFGHALAAAYERGARAAGHELRLIDVARLDFPLLATREDWETGCVPLALADAQASLLWAEHIAVFFPLWLGTMPARLKGFLEQVLRPGMVTENGRAVPWNRVLAGRSARVVVTMGMPALWYRWVYFAHGVRGLERSVLAFSGVGPIRESLIGLIESGHARHARWLARMEKLGAAGK